jgi:hypothetical protein
LIEPVEGFPQKNSEAAELVALAIGLDGENASEVHAGDARFRVLLRLSGSATAAPMKD